MATVRGNKSLLQQFVRVFCLLFVVVVEEGYSFLNRFAEVVFLFAEAELHSVVI